MVAVVVLAATTLAATRPIGVLPPLGAWLDPSNGIWSAASGRGFPDSLAVSVASLGESVQVVYDDRGVPHIRAESMEDAWRALGFVVARDRLFQLELQARAGAGTLTGLLGARALAADRRTRELGTPRAAEHNWQAMPEDAVGRRASVAFAEGVNAWVDGLRRRDFPVEYHILGVRPSRWEPVNTLHVMSRMMYTLSYMPFELDVEPLRDRMGDDIVSALFPQSGPFEEPIQPAGSGMPRLRRDPIPPPPVAGFAEPGSAAPSGAVPARSSAAALSAPPTSTGSFAGGGANQATRTRETADAVLGSNNWAVSPQRSASGHALLAGDPHLALTLPSIWYEVRIQVPDTLDAYGVTIPGAPGILIGFNRDVAWTYTNSGADVVDFWRETVDDSAKPRRYMLDGAWRDLELYVENHHAPDGSLVASDTVPYTHRGPLQRHGGEWLSMRWTAHEEGDVAGPFMGAAHAGSVAAFMDATRKLIAPAQNMLVADRAGTIGIHTPGLFPIRAGDGRGDVIRDGSSSAADWQGWWSPDEFVRSVNPDQGFLASANQDPFTADAAPRYMGFDWPTPWRALHINSLLRADARVTPETMGRWQTHPGSARADLFAPAFLAAAAQVEGDSVLARASALLAAWNRRYTPDDSLAVLFEAAMRELHDHTWDEFRSDSTLTASPSDAMLGALLADAGNPWWDVQQTVVREDRDQVLAAALRQGLLRTLETRGEPGSEAWTWSNARGANIHHALGLEPFSRLAIPIQGGPGLLNPLFASGTHGASWRMVVELGDQVQGWGIYPGGQSGDPSSPHYDDRLQAWQNGTLQALHFPASPDDLTGSARSSVLRLVP